MLPSPYAFGRINFSGWGNLIDLQVLGYTEKDGQPTPLSKKMLYYGFRELRGFETEKCPPLNAGTEAGEIQNCGECEHRIDCPALKFALGLVAKNAIIHADATGFVPNL
jgi:hypothetical protein